MTAYKRPVFFDRDIKSFSELSADSGLDLGIVARSILADAALTVGGTVDGTVSIKNASDVETIKLDGATATATLGGASAYSQVVVAADDASVGSEVRVGKIAADHNNARLGEVGLNLYLNNQLKSGYGFGGMLIKDDLGSRIRWQVGSDDGAAYWLRAWDADGGINYELNPTTASLTLQATGNATALLIDGQLNKISGLQTDQIVGGTDAANKAYVDSMAQGLAIKGACHVSSQGNLADLATTTEVDGHTLSVGERVLVRYQSTAVENGIYEFDGTGLVRTADMAAGSHAAGAFTFVQFGTNADQGWVCTADAPADVVGTDALPWTQFSAAGVIEAGDGLQLIGTVLSAKLDGTTLAASAAGLKVLGLPAEFEIDGSAVSAAVTAANLGTLVDGAAGDAAALHSHSADAEYLPAAAGLAAGQAAIISAAGEAATAGTTTAGAYMIGVCESIASGSARIVRGGLAVGVLSGATAGDVYYVQADGTLSTALPSDGRVVMAGIAKSASDLHVQVRDFGSILAA